MKKLTGILLLVFILAGCERGQTEIIIVPRNYIGRVLIVYDQAKGENPTYQNDKLIFTIPGNGILKTTLSPNTGWMEIPEVYYEKISSENRIPFKLNFRTLPIDSVVAAGGTAGSFKTLKGKIRFLEYYIGNRMQIHEAYENDQGFDILKQLK